MQFSDFFPLFLLDKAFKSFSTIVRIVKSCIWEERAQCTSVLGSTTSSIWGMTTWKATLQ